MSQFRNDGEMKFFCADSSSKVKIHRRTTFAIGTSSEVNFRRDEIILEETK